MRLKGVKVLSTKIGVVCLSIVACITVATAFAHMSCIYFGPECYSAQMAPTIIVESAKSGSLLAPVGTIIVSLVFVIFGGYALSAAKLLPKLPLRTLGIYAISALCIIRGILPLQLWVRHPDKVSSTVLIVGFVWLIVGLLYIFGFRAMNEKHA